MSGVRVVHRSLLAVLALAALTLAALSAHAEEEFGTQALAYGDTIDIELDFQSGRSMDVEYEVTVVSGPSVWVYFVDLAGYRDYIDPSQVTFAYYETWSSFDTFSAHTGFTVDEYDTYFLIIENSDGSQQTATVRYRVTYDVDSGASRTLMYVLAGIVAIVLVVVFLALAVRARARSASYHPPVLPGTQSGQYIPGTQTQYPQQGPYYQEPSFWERQYDDRHDHHHHHYGRSDYGHGRRSSPSNRSPRRTMRKRR